MKFEQLANVFATISVIIARYAPNANCFGGDRGVLDTNSSDHLNWANRQGNANVLLQNLEWKLGLALNCMDASRRADFFADVSLALAQADASQ